MKKSIDWRIFFILLTLTLASIACVFPYVLTVQGELIQKIGQPVKLLFFAQIVQSLIMFSVAIYLGLLLNKKIGFRPPLLAAILDKENYQVILKNITKISIITGIVSAAAIFALDPLFTSGGADISTHQNLAPAWQKLLAAFYGGITEEVLMRLFLMTLFIWISMKLFRQKQPSNAGIWFSIILASVIFGLGHLPITASVTAITPLVVARAIILNSIAGIPFGWLYWKKGLEAAIIAHFTADVFLLTLLPLFYSILST